METEANKENSFRGSCAICQCSFNLSGNISALHCGHTFHLLCIKKWLEVKKECPNCRKRVPRNDGFIEKLYFDKDFCGESTSTVDYAEMSEKLADELSEEKKTTEELRKVAKCAEDKVKSLEKKILREKEKYNREVPMLTTRNRHLEMMAAEADNYKLQLDEAKVKLKATELYRILSYKNTDNPDIKLSQFVKNGDVAIEKLLEVLRKQNKELSKKRTEAVQETERIQKEMKALKLVIRDNENVISALRVEINDLRELANVSTPQNKRLRNILMSDNKRKSLGFNSTNPLLAEDSFNNDIVDLTNESFNEPKTTIDEESHFETKFRKINNIIKNKRDEKETITLDDSADFSFDIEIPNTVMRRVPLAKKCNKPVSMPCFEYESNTPFKPRAINNLKRSMPMASNVQNKSKRTTN